ncbi:N-acetylmuramoyl-L-alanine amidase [Dictyoglomus thermophilum]|uniref:N-acetylmuramoyl-L-alanine amidase n=1 Tax=Dictyoglomus thermophilum TaxID=14 RepID=UPI0005A116CA|nr:N-acetylmuramoyl-L-alanine amidase [Dictyoglomus thermophilum]
MHCRKWSFVLFFILFLLVSNYILGNELSFLEIDYLGERVKILTTLKEINNDIYIPLPLFSSTFGYFYKQIDDKVYFYESNNEFFVAKIGEKKVSLYGKSAALINPLLKEDNTVYFPLSSFYRLLGYRVYLKNNILYIVNELSGVKYSKGVLTINLRGKSKINFNTLNLDSPPRFVLDLQSVVFIDNKGEVKLNDPYIKSIRYSQFTVAPYVVRVVIEFKKQVLEPNIKKELGKLILEFPLKYGGDEEKNDSKNFVKLSDMTWKEEDNTLNFFLIFSDTFTYTKNFLPNPPRYYYDVLDAESALTYTSISIQKEPVNLVRIGEKLEDSRKLRIVFETYTDTVYLTEEVYSNTLKISFRIPKKEENLSNNNSLTEKNSTRYTVFIDPGHGGSDPGAIYGDIKEKDINLKVSLKLAEKLRNKGYIVYILRENDISLSLDDRVSFINKKINLDNVLLASSILISIHTNAAFSSDVRGIEVCYANDLSEGLVKTIVDIFNSNGFVVRRAIKGKFYVLSRVPIPSVIIEMGFITNDVDRSLLLNEDYQDKLIDKIIEAVEKYFEGGKNE